MTATDRVAQIVGDRWRKTRERRERVAELPPTELYAGNRTNKRIGADGGVLGADRPKQSSSSIGESLEAGRDARTLANDQALRAAIAEIYQEIQEVANRRGALFFQGGATNPTNDPNDDANGGVNRAYQRFDNQLLYNGDRTTPGNLWVHAQATATESEEWLKIQAGPAILYESRPPDYDLADPINNPPPHNPADGDIWVDISPATKGGQYRYWRYRASTNLYYNTSGNIAFYGGDPTLSGISPDSLVDGDMLYARDAGAGITWAYIWIDGTWNDASCCPDDPGPPPGDSTCPPGEYKEPGNPYGPCTSDDPFD